MQYKSTPKTRRAGAVSSTLKSCLAVDLAIRSSSVYSTKQANKVSKRLGMQGSGKEYDQVFVPILRFLAACGTARLHADAHLGWLQIGEARYSQTKRCCSFASLLTCQIEQVGHQRYSSSHKSRHVLVQIHRPAAKERQMIPIPYLLRLSRDMEAE